MALTLIKTSAEGVVTKIALPSAQAIQVEAKAHYTIIDSVTGKAPMSVQVMNIDNSLVIQKAPTPLQVINFDNSLVISEGAAGANETVAEIDQFFEEGIEASFAGDGSEQLTQTRENHLITSSTRLSASVVFGLAWEAPSKLEVSINTMSDTLLHYLNCRV